MRAWWVAQPGPIETGPLVSGERPDPVPGPGEILLRVRVCGVCRTDLHLAEGELAARRPGVVPGHEVVGEVIGASFGLSPEWAVQDADDARHSRTQYAPDPVASASYGFPAPGRYRVSLDLDVANGPIDWIEASLAGELKETHEGGSGSLLLSYEAEIEAFYA